MKKIVVLFSFMLALVPSLAFADGSHFFDFSGVLVSKDAAISPSLATCSTPLLIIQDAGFLSACAAVAPAEKNGEETVKFLPGLGLAGKGAFGVALFLRGEDILLGLSIPLEDVMNSAARLSGLTK